jgi:glutathione S-transferase
MKLYCDPVTVNCRKVLAGLDLIGAEFEKVHVDYFTGEHRAEGYRELNPNAALPTLVDGDFVLWESNAILAYVADKLGNCEA